MRRWNLLAGWLLAVLVSTGLTWQIVSAADNRVSQRPAAPLDLAASAATGATTTTLSTPTTEPSAAPGESPPPAEGPPATTSTTTSTTVVPADDTSQETWTTHTEGTPGGSVVLRYREDEVMLQAVSPAPGFQVEVNKEGPPEVDVEFQGVALKVRVRAEWREGRLDLDVRLTD